MTATMREAFADLMLNVAIDDESLTVLVGDISHGILQPFARRFPERYYNVGICEPAIVNMASGLSQVGLTPVVHTIAPFLIERAYEQIKLDFGYQARGVNLVSVGGAFDYAQLGCSHHCYSDVSLVSHIEGSQVFVPGSVHEFERLFLQSYKDPCINYYRLTEFPYAFETGNWEVPVGKALRVREGQDITLATTGAQLQTAWEAAEVLSSEGIDLEIMHFPTMKPFDGESLRASAFKTRRLISLEELSAQDGLFNLCLQSIVGLDDMRVHQLAIQGFVHGYGSREDLCVAAGLTVHNVLDAARRLVEQP